MPPATILLVAIHVPVKLDIQVMVKNAKVREMDDFIFVSRSNLTPSQLCNMLVSLFISNYYYYRVGDKVLCKVLTNNGRVAKWCKTHVSYSQGLWFKRCLKTMFHGSTQTM